MARLLALVPAAALLLAAAPLRAQSVISAQSGLVHHVEGVVQVDGKPVRIKFGDFPQLRDSSRVQTLEGRAEILLTPGVFLRMAEETSVRLLSTKLSDTRVEVEAGTVLVECAELEKENGVALLHGGHVVTLRKPGLFRLETDGPLLRVYEGEVMVGMEGSEPLKVKAGRQLSLGATEVAKFDRNVGDPLYRWSSRRASYLALANVSAAKGLHDRRTAWGTGGWSYNPYFGMVTYIPGSGTWVSPFGYRYWSPRQVEWAYRPAIVATPDFGNAGWAGSSSMGAPSSASVRAGGYSGGGMSGGGYTGSTATVNAPAPSSGSGGGSVREGGISQGGGASGGRRGN